MSAGKRVAIVSRDLTPGGHGPPLQGEGSTGPVRTPRLGFVALEQLSLKLRPDEVPDEVAALFAEADRRCDDFFGEGLGRRYPRYIPSDPAIVHAALVHLRERGLVRGRTFCEWGCGFGVAACMASLLGYTAYGIEIEPELADRAETLAADFGIPVTILNTSYLPEGYEECDGVGGKDLLVPEKTTGRGERVEVAPEYEGLDPDEVDVFFVYPWPGQEELMMDLFQAMAGEGALLLVYNGDREITAYLRTEDGEDW